MPDPLPQNPLDSAWSPGVEPDIPREFRTLETIFRPDCVLSRLDDISELSTLTGLAHQELTVFRAERLALHELIVRVTADIAVAEGDEEEIFGRNFRRIATRIFDTYIAPQLEDIHTAHATLCSEAQTLTRTILAQTLFQRTPPAAARGFFRKLFGARTKPAPVETVQETEHRVVNAYRTAGLAATDPLQRAVYRSLYRVLGAMAARRGRLGADLDLLSMLVARHVGNTYGSQVIGQTITPLIDAAIEQEGYARVPNRAAPVLISLKGASASGKSSLRPQIKQIMREQGIEPDGYATISPDIWRRLLLDYESLGPAIKYAGHLTSRELMVIDGKLDRYIRDKARRDHAIPHFLVDRFRFDSFSSEQVARVLHDTYAQYVDIMVMYFIVTPPEETVERGWQRALERGRYKSVEDFLGHSVEAYAGMPKIFFKWLAYARPEFRYTFLDNAVPKGTFPKTIAVGTQDAIEIFDPVAFINIERYQKINLNARSPDEVYVPAQDMALEKNTGFLQEIVRRIGQVTFTEPVTGTPYLQTRRGVFEVLDTDSLNRILATPDIRQIFAAMAPQLAATANAGPDPNPISPPLLRSAG